MLRASTWMRLAVLVAGAAAVWVILGVANFVADPPGWALLIAIFAVGGAILAPRARRHRVRVRVKGGDDRLARRVGAHVTLHVTDATAPAIRRALKAGAAAATLALPGHGVVRATAEERDLPGPDARLRVRLDVEGSGADSSWARVAEDAFARGFVESFEEAGLAAARV